MQLMDTKKYMNSFFCGCKVMQLVCQNPVIGYRIIERIEKESCNCLQNFIILGGDII